MTATPNYAPKSFYRSEAMKALYDSVKDRISISAEQFSKAFDGWEVIPLYRNGEIVGGFVVNGNEVHIGYSKLPRSSIRGHIRTIFQPVLDRCGVLVTTVQESNERGLKFCRRMGFVETKRENGIVYMQCERFKYE